MSDQAPDPQQELAQLVNQTVYLGIRRLDQDGTVVSEDSALGTITAAGENGIFITKTDGSEQKLPPAAAAFQPCPPDAVQVKEGQEPPKLISLWQAGPAEDNPQATKWTWMKLKFPG